MIILSNSHHKSDVFLSRHNPPANTQDTVVPPYGTIRKNHHTHIPYYALEVYRSTGSTSRLRSTVVRCLTAEHHTTVPVPVVVVVEKLATRCEKTTSATYTTILEPNQL